MDGCAAVLGLRELRQGEPQTSDAPIVLRFNVDQSVRECRNKCTMPLD